MQHAARRGAAIRSRWTVIPFFLLLLAMHWRIKLHNFFFFFSSFAVTTGAGSTTKKSSVGSFESGNLSWKQMSMKEERMNVLIQTNLSAFNRWSTLHSSSVHWLCFFIFFSFIWLSEEHPETFFLLQKDIFIYYENLEKRPSLPQHRV